MRLASTVLCLVWTVATASRLHAETPPAPVADPGYEQQAVGVRNLTHLARAGSGRDRADAWADAPWDAFQGHDHHPIDEETFFRIVGRDDLLQRHHRKALVKSSLTYGGGALIVGGLVFAALSALSRAHFGGQAAGACTTPDFCDPKPSGPSPYWGLGIAATGLVSIFVGHTITPTPIDADEADHLARDYDQSLRTSLGVSETASRP
jgi:hypothetical protein